MHNKKEACSEPVYKVQRTLLCLLPSVSPVVFVFNDYLTAII
ncbi:hypothetical protein BIFADO_00563 [Bifidobacterium adolescentis L2-32]|uniref:Uncharacterized protein n=1 Tax=Bifidobacterium adolescentis L2-32 TaxID=411481 RepID=A7A413_BIFAD|nr:hypothetical protein BIFADO_00563 [Bifidobacterium adolescentis L2-32]